MSTNRTVYPKERQVVIDAAVSEAVRWGRSWADQWYYSLPPKERELFYGGFSHFVDACATRYQEHLSASHNPPNDLNDDYSQGIIQG